MNLPNKLTVLRVLMIPLFLVFYFADGIPHHFIWALVVFAAASLTDMLDGKIARSRGLVTDFGKLMDPLADKLLVISALVCLMQGGTLMNVCLILILSREFLVTSIRLLAASGGKVLAADRWGKLKTVSQMVWVCLALLYAALLRISAVPQSLLRVLSSLVMCLFIVMVTLTIASGANYCWKNRELFADM